MAFRKNVNNTVTYFAKNFKIMQIHSIKKFLVKKITKLISL